MKRKQEKSKSLLVSAKRLPPLKIENAKTRDEKACTVNRRDKDKQIISGALRPGLPIAFEREVSNKTEAFRKVPGDGEIKLNGP
jgi:hypothetical protein